MMKVVFVHRQLEVTSKDVINIGVKFLFHHRKLRELSNAYVTTLVTMDSKGDKYNKNYICAKTIGNHTQEKS